MEKSIQERNEAITEGELKIMGHSLGINTYNDLRSTLKKDKILPKEFYRNYFCASVNHKDFPTLDSLLRRGLMNSWEQFGNLYFGVTEKGQEVFRSEFKRFCIQYEEYNKQPK